MIKKYSMILFLIALSLIIVGCGSNDASPNQNEDGKAVKKIMVGTEAANSPFSFLDKGEIVGFDIDLLDEVMKELGYEYELNNFGWDHLFAAVSNKEIDMAISNIAITEERKQSYDYSNPYFETRQLIMTQENSPITSSDDLEGKLVGVQNGTTGAVTAENLLGVNNPNIKKYDSYNLLINELVNGTVDAVVMDNIVTQEYLKNNPNVKLNLIEDPENFEAEHVGMLFPKDSDLISDINEALEKIIKSDKYIEIYEKWYEQKPDNVEKLLELQE